ncbi:hypothetical protein F7984_15725 [Pradoshia sp. D12]|uniref:hypothetical protein n=1 Tax=unclassified Bacillus (in: firmicutes) TaxID=185979 RepID=UPI00080ADBAD|nr:MULTISPECIES: hypothetical protein [unclassified Bacillus (in: firmicutes)]OCA81916.1 hypothetical protein A8L44_15095 [Bacillus sp. FJAT-27986]QFK72593.1 hypothetical protein F7984_15725 [Pradoshia sp. D12]TPF70663.1 hypothetical protein FHY44_15495 [Bacillus sp. D12]
MDINHILRNFNEDLQNSNSLTFPICVDSFTNYWSTEFGSLDELPKEVDQLIAKRGLELGLLEEEINQ